MKNPVTANEFVEQKLHEGLLAIEKAFSCHALTFSGPLLNGSMTFPEHCREEEGHPKPASKKLVILLTIQAGCFSRCSGWSQRYDGITESSIL